MCPPTPVKDKVLKKTRGDKNPSGDPSYRSLSQSSLDFYPSASLLSPTPVSAGRSNSGWHPAPPPPPSPLPWVWHRPGVCAWLARASLAAASLWPSTLHLLQSSADRHLSVSCFGHISLSFMADGDRAHLLQTVAAGGGARGTHPGVGTLLNRRRSPDGLETVKPTSLTAD